MAEALKPYVDALCAKDAQFAKEYNQRKDELKDFAKLFYEQCKKKASGSCGVFGSDEELQGQLIHFFHEPKGTVTELDLNVTVTKSETKATAPKAPTAPSAPTAPTAPSAPTAPTAPPMQVVIPSASEDVESEEDDDDEFDPFA